MNRNRPVGRNGSRPYCLRRQSVMERISLGVLLGTILVLAMVCVYPYPQEAYGAYDDDLGFETAADLLNRGRYLEALGIYQEISELSDRNEHQAQALLYSGTIYGLFLEQYDSALRQYEKVIRNYPESLSAQEAVFNSGTVSYEQDQYERAYNYFKTYLDSYPEGARRSTVAFWADSAQIRAKEKTAPPLSLPRLPEPEAIISVLIKGDATDAVLSAETPLRVLDPLAGRPFPIQAETLRFSSNGAILVVNGQSLGSKLCRVVSKGRIVRVDGRPFRGNITLSAESNGLRVINHLPIEQYLYGVVPREMPASWPREALMAQAVAARSYALYIRSKSKDKGYHVVASTSSQVYGGYDSEAVAANGAVDLTRGQVMTHRGKLIVAYFHSNSGGYTEDAKNVWSADLPYLKGVPDRYSLDTPGSNWDFFMTLEDLRDRLNRYGLSIARVKKIDYLGVSPAGRALKIRVTTDSQDFILKGNAFRIKVGATRLKSLLLDMEIRGDGIRLKGKGYGHGVGMSQWGARNMAQEGFTYRQILKHYYRGVDIVSIDRS